MDKIDRQLERLRSPDKNIRYEACKQLSDVPNLSQEAITALEQASHDPDIAVAHAARRALLADSQDKVQCERCGRIEGQEILTCPERAQGRCPYLVSNLAPFDSRVTSAFGMLFLILLLLSLWQSENRVFILFSVILFFFFIVALLLTLRTSTLLYDPVSRLRWKQTAFLRITTQRTLILEGYPLRIDLSFSRSLLFPPSVTKFSETTLKTWTLAHATAVFRAALVGLLARRVVQIRKYTKYVARWRGDFKRDQIVYVLTASQEIDSASIDGELEKQIVLVLRSWVKRSWGEVQEWPDGAPIYQVVRAVFGKDVSSPEQWVFNLVARDAVTYGSGRLEGWPWKRYKPSAIRDVRLQSELATINRLSSELAKQQPAFSKTLNGEIARAIRSRERQQDDMPWR